ncbi:MAG: hypothetical protein Q8M98_01640 [Candidatus Cloacimonadaceae bacterium]|nr:hypothetical protein [Candidatus Cloacimonadaceae bacterium]MDP3113455.1 hypothetical protein [Candidatus Cloacimonadaceae bacterium]
MTVKGNYHLLFASQLITGILTYFACLKIGIWGLLIGFIPFAIGMIVVLYKHETDERELSIAHKVNSYESISAGVLAGIIYFIFPDINWFFALVSGISVVRGIIGLLYFTLQ